MTHFRNSVRMPKDIVWDPHERFSLDTPVFRVAGRALSDSELSRVASGRALGAQGGAECRPPLNDSKLCEKRSWGSQTQK